jgi:proteasome lid subunit RPN8/RPN11
MPAEHIIQRNESLSTIARFYKIADWKSIWMDPRNSTLRQARKVPERIRPGDRLFIPEPSPRSTPAKLTVAPPDQASTLLWFNPMETDAPCLGELKVKLSLYKKKERGVPFAPGASAWEEWELFQSSLLPLGHFEARADTQGVIRLNLRSSPAKEFSIDLIWDDAHQPPIPYFSNKWPRKPGDGPIPWQALEVGQKHILTLPNKRHTVEQIATKLQLVRRKQWGSKKPDYLKMEGDWDYTDIVIHHSGNSGEKDPSQIESKHMKKWEDVGYHYLVRPDGAIYEGRHLAFKGSHVEKENTHKIGVLVMGDFESNWWDSDDDLSAGQRNAVRKIISTLKQAFPTILTLGGHKDYKNTECPGDLLYRELGGLRKEFELKAPAK